MRTVLSLVLAISLPSLAMAEPECRDWSEPHFWQQAEASVVGKCIDEGADVSVRNERGLTPLHLAAANGIPETVLTLVEAGAEVDARTDKGWTPIYSDFLTSPRNVSGR